MEDSNEEMFMMKSLILLAALSWVTFSYARTPVAQENMKDVESFKVEKPEQERKREVAGGKFKKKEAPKEESMESDDSDSEVRYWQYSE
jgi:hypothetical protein